MTGDAHCEFVKAEVSDRGSAESNREAVARELGCCPSRLSAVEVQDVCCGRRCFACGGVIERGETALVYCSSLDGSPLFFCADRTACGERRSRRQAERCVAEERLWLGVVPLPGGSGE